MIKKLAGSILHQFGYKLMPIKAIKMRHSDMQNDDTFQHIYGKCEPFTLTTPERMYGLHNAVNYIIKNNIEGDFVECGVWRGGSAMMMAETLLYHRKSNPELYLYDTFEGMSEPTDQDVTFSGETAAATWQGKYQCLADEQDVRQNMALTAYPNEKLRFVKGKVEETIPTTMPSKIALLRLDTDWFESTYHELVHLFPLLVKGGVLIIDDYGHWQGARKAVDKYFEETQIPILLNRIDYTGRVAIKL